MRGFGRWNLAEALGSGAKDQRGTRVAKDPKQKSPDEPSDVKPITTLNAHACLSERTGSGLP
jgi:hypothetical protein